MRKICFKYQIYRVLRKVNILDVVDDSEVGVIPSRGVNGIVVVVMVVFDERDVLVASESE